MSVRKLRKMLKERYSDKAVSEILRWYKGGERV